MNKTKKQLDIAYKSNFKIEIDGIDSKHIVNFTLPNMDDYGSKEGRISARFHYGALKELIDWHQTESFRSVKIIVFAKEEEEITVATMEFNGKINYLNLGANWMKKQDFNSDGCDDEECFECHGEKAAAAEEEKETKNKKKDVPLILSTEIFFDRLTMTNVD